MTLKCILNTVCITYHFPHLILSDSALIITIKKLHLIFIATLIEYLFVGIKLLFFILSKGLFSGRIGYLLVYQRWGSSDFVVNNNWGSYYVMGLSIKGYTGIKIKENEAMRKKVQK